MEKRVGELTYFVDKESSSLQWLAALIHEKEQEATRSLIKAESEKESDKLRGRIILSKELLKQINEL